MNEEEIDYSEWGNCPNCGRQVHESQMGNECGIICCHYCCQNVINNPVDYNEPE